MNSHLVMYVLLPVAMVVLVPFFFLVIDGAAFPQDSNQVVIREPGRRTHGAPMDAAPEAREDLDFALLSQAVYQEPVDDEKTREGKALNPDATLGDMQWIRWMDFPKGDLKTTIDDVHLRVEVWSNSSSKKVAVTFGGTVLRNLKDWRSDLRWFIPHHHDEYTVIVKDFGSEFVKEYHRRKQLPGWDFLGEAQLFSTGHSLGGGLAQEFAYSLPKDTHMLPVKKVYAFDPSPVTGFYSVDEGLRVYNSESLSIDRIYQRGEILAFFRSLTNLVYPPSASRPTIRQVRYNVFYSRNPFAGHSMAELAFGLDKLSRRQEVTAVP